MSYRSAFEVGRLLNELDHSFQLALLGIHPTRPIPDVFAALRLACRDLGSDTQARAQLVESVEFVRDEWNGFFNTEWHADLLSDAEIEFDSPHSGLTIREQVARVTWHVRPLIDRLHQSLNCLLRANLCEAVDLGRYVGRAEHVQPVADFLVAGVEDIHSVRLVDWRTSSPRQPRARHFSDLRLDAAGFPDAPWAVEAFAQWTSFATRHGIEVAPEFAGRPQADGFSSRIVEGLKRLDDLNPPEFDPADDAGYLGLYISGTHVRRVGMQETVDISSTLWRNVLQLLISNGPRITTTIDLALEWESLGGQTASPEVSTTLRSTISALRNRLNLLRVRIRNIRNVGYQLEPVEVAGSGMPAA